MPTAGSSRAPAAAREIVVVGHGMVGHRLVEAVRARDADGSLRITVLAEEGDAAYDRVGLTSYTESWDRACWPCRVTITPVTSGFGCY